MPKPPHKPPQTRARRRVGRGWKPVRGELVELRQWGNPLRCGVVDSVMPDSSGFWIGAHGANQRLFVHLDYDDLEVWV